VSVRSGLEFSFTPTDFSVPPHASALCSVCSVLAFYSLASLQFGVGISVSLAYIYVIYPPLPPHHFRCGHICVYVDRRVNIYLPKLLFIRVHYCTGGFWFCLFISKINRYFRSLYKRAFSHDLWLIGSFDQRGFAPVGHCIQQVAFDHYRRTSLVHRPYTR
jgi:hypothetical protein